MPMNPIAQQILCLQALCHTPSIDAATKACGLSQHDFMAVLDAAETMYGRPLVLLQETVHLTDMGKTLLRCAPTVLGTVVPGPVEPMDVGLARLIERRSVSPKRLSGPGPDAEQIQTMLRAALAAPDHGSLHPWRTLEFHAHQREALADLFEAEKLRRDPLASDSDRQRAREHATRPPSLLAFIVSLRERTGVPEREQWLAAGAALCNFLNAAHQLGFGAIMLSGERCHDPLLIQELGLHKGEVLAGFISMGQVAQVPPKRKPVSPSEVWSGWVGRSNAFARTDERACEPPLKG